MWAVEWVFPFISMTYRVLSKRVCNVFRFHQIYYDGQTYYALEASKEIDNPDQRIAEDVRAFTQVSLEFLITVLTSCIDLASFSTILYS